ncbi:MAG: DNA repair protein RecO [Alphaproteobacteria bacterium]|nr:DNA repair protein RecO [Alphaproteobacteria bacterium]
MNWQDEGFVLSVRKHGESSAIVNLLTKHHGRHAGYVRGGASKKQKATYQIGNMVEVKWSSRIDDALGSYACDVLNCYPAVVMGDSLKLACLVSACEFANVVLPERESVEFVFHAMHGLLSDLRDSVGGYGEEEYAFLKTYVLWEMVLLNALGFGLSLDKCASTGITENLIYVSPKTGRAVSAEAGEAWKDKLLPLPRFIAERAFVGGRQEQKSLIEEILDGFLLTGYFLNRHVLEVGRLEFPASRERLIAKIKNIKKKD